MHIILSPSKTQNLDCRQFSQTSTPLFLEQCESLVKRLRSYDIEALEKLMKMSQKLAEQNWQRYDTFQFPPTQENSRQALLTFQGDVFSGISSDSYTEVDFAFAQDHLRILSGLYGILRPLDLIQPYRLEMATKFSTNKQDSLYTFWQETITQTLNDELQNSAQPTLLNLASREYSKVIDIKKLNATIINVAFKEKKEETYKVVAIHAKRARGKMVDYIIKRRVDTPEELPSFNEDGYNFQEELSSATNLVFHRE